MIKLDDITVALPAGSPHAAPILKNISVTIAEGEWVALAGANGSGKSTLLGTLAGLWPVASGVADLPGGTTALLLQEPDNQFVASSVQNELALSLPPGFGRSERDARIATAVDKFSLGEFLGRNPHELSGGEKQRLALATVWLSDPGVLLLDEPTSYLDAIERARCIEFVSELNNGGATVIWATPGGDELANAARVCYLEDGTVRFDGPANEFSRTAAESNFDVILDGQPPWGDCIVERGKRITSDSPVGSRSAVVSLRSTSFAYAGRDVLQNVTFDIHEGECIGVSGQNGSGKTTLLSLLSGILQPTNGVIHRKYPKPVDRPRAAGRPEQMVFHLFQNPERLFFAETVFEEIAFGLKALKVGQAELPAIVSRALEEVALDPGEFQQRMPFSLSLGEMRRLAFAMASALRPRLILLDEPTSCLDAGGYRTVFDVVNTLLSGGSTVVVASHDLPLLERLADRILVVENGRVTQAAR